MRHVLVVYLSIGILSSSLSFGDCRPVFSKLSAHEIASAHQSIIQDLQQGRVVEAAKKRINGNFHDLWWGTLENPETGRRRQVIIKPREWGDNDGWARAPMEYVAYVLNRALGMDYVPPTVYRTNIQVGNLLVHEAPLIYVVPKAEILFETSQSQWGGITKAALQSDHRVLCVLLHNSDGHAKNLLLGKHWVDGEMRPAFIDFGASLRKGTCVTMRRYPAPGNSEPVSVIRKNTFLRLQELKKEDLLEVRNYLTQEEMNEILHRRDGIVTYFKKLIEEQGEERVILLD